MVYPTRIFIGGLESLSEIGARVTIFFGQDTNKDTVPDHLPGFLEVSGREIVKIQSSFPPARFLGV